MTLSIVIPAYNEERRLSSTLDAVLAWLDSSPYRGAEVLIVDDGSTDATAALVESRAATDSRLRLLRNPGNRGKGYAIRHGMLEAQGDWILFSDADLSSPIEEFSKLLAAALAQDAAIAIGSRALDRSLIGVHQSQCRGSRTRSRRGRGGRAGRRGFPAGTWTWDGRPQGGSGADVEAHQFEFLLPYVASD